MEYVRQFGDLAFTWLSLAHTQTYYLALIQIADLTGYLGITFWICCVNLLIYRIWMKRGKIKENLKPVILLVCGFGLLIAYGYGRLQSLEYTEGIRAAYVQPNFATRVTWDPPAVRKNIDSLLSYGTWLAQMKPDLVVWPETSVPSMIRDDREQLARIKSQVTDKNFNLLLGTRDYSVQNSDTLRHNSVIAIDAKSDTLQSYHKMRLVPQEEGLPFRKILRYFVPESDRKKYLRPGNN